MHFKSVLVFLPFGRRRLVPGLFLFLPWDWNSGTEPHCSLCPPGLPEMRGGGAMLQAELCAQTRALPMQRAVLRGSKEPLANPDLRFGSAGSRMPCELSGPWFSLV